MNWFKKLNIGAKLALGFTVMLVLIAITGVVGYRASGKIQANLNEIFSRRMPALDYLIEADRDLQQLLVAERSMIFTPAGSDTFKQFVEDYEENLGQARQRFDKYKSLASSAEEKALAEKFEVEWTAWMPTSRQVVDACKTDAVEAREQARKLTVGETSVRFEAMRDVIDQLTEISLAGAKAAEEDARGAYRFTGIVQVGLVAFALACGLVLMWTIGRAVTGPLRKVIAGLTSASQEVTHGAVQVAGAGQGLAEGASEQAAAIEETSSSLEEMASMTRQNANHAAEADQLMQSANQVVEKANTTMSRLNGSMTEIIQASQETSKIIKTIDEIAFQTNLLALNAAVEAARAGEAGAGFAVVADEVRNLAMRAAEAARNTATLIEGTVKKIQDGSDLVRNTDEAFSEVTASTSKVGQLVSEIAAASREQAQGIDQINTAVTEMDKVTQSNAANAEESAAAAETMRVQARELLAYVDDLEALVGGRQNRSAESPDVSAPSKSWKAGSKDKPLARPRAAAHRSLAKPRRPLIAAPQDEDDSF